MYHPGFECDAPGERVSASGNWMLSCKFLQLRRHAMKRRDAVNIAITKEDDRLLCLAKPPGRLDKRVEHWLKLELRATYDFKNIGGGRLLLEGFAQLIKQPCVLDGDDGLGGKVLNQLDLLVGEWQDLLAIYANRTNQLVFFEHWHVEYGSGASKRRQAPARVFRLGQDISDMDCCFCVGDATKWVFGAGS